MILFSDEENDKWKVSVNSIREETLSLELSAGKSLVKQFINADVIFRNLYKCGEKNQDPSKNDK